MKTTKQTAGLIGKTVYAVSNAGARPTADSASSIGEIVKVEDTQFGTFATVIWSEGEKAGRFEPYRLQSIKLAEEPDGIGVYFA